MASAADGVGGGREGREEAGREGRARQGNPTSTSHVNNLPQVFATTGKCCEHITILGLLLPDADHLHTITSFSTSWPREPRRSEWIPGTGFAWPGFVSGWLEVRRP